MIEHRASRRPRRARSRRQHARAPGGGDTDQIKAVAAGECDVALANTYYYARAPPLEDVLARRAGARRVKTGLPATVSTDQVPEYPALPQARQHLGPGVLRLDAPAADPRPTAAVRFLPEYRRATTRHRFRPSPMSATSSRAAGREERRSREESRLDAMGAVQGPTPRLPIAVLGRNTPAAQAFVDRARSWRGAIGGAAGRPAARTLIPAPCAAARRPAPARRSDGVPTATIASDGSAASASRLSRRTSRPASRACRS